MKIMGTFLACASIAGASLPGRVSAQDALDLRLFDDGAGPIMLCSPDGANGGINYEDGRAVDWASAKDEIVIKYFRDNDVKLYSLEMTPSGTMQVDASGKHDVTGTDMEKSGKEDYAALRTKCIQRVLLEKTRASASKLVS